MHALQISLFASAIALVTACGSASENLNANTETQPAVSAAESEDDFSLSKRVENDGCVIGVVGPTVFSKAAPQALVVKYSFNYLSSGDRIALRNPSLPNFLSGVLPSKSGTISIDITQLAAGEYKLVGLTNTHVTDRAKDCGLAKTIIIRNK
ncbi:MAG: hypothetical protein RLZZ488_74 [Pseudomonadota bacterium]|jgi:hypothetical protein